MKVRLSLILGLLLFGSALYAAKPPGELARVNDEPITVADLKEQFVKRHGGHTKFLGGEEEAKVFLNLVIDQRLLIQEAYNLGLETEPAVKERVDAYRDQKAVEHLVKSEIEGKSEPAAMEVVEAWEKNTSRIYFTRQIVVDTREEAEEVRAALLKGADFETIARDCSFGASRTRGGVLPPTGWGSMPPEWEAAVFGLEPGEVSEVIDTGKGFEIIQFFYSEEMPRPDFDKAADRVRLILRQRNTDRRKKEFSEELWTKYHASKAAIDFSPDGFFSLSKTAPDTAVASWDGGTLALKDLASTEELHMLALSPSGRAAQEIEDRVREIVNGQLVSLEAKARKVAEVPEVAEHVRKYQEDLMEAELYQDHILKDVKVADADVRAYYEEHKAELADPEKRKVSHILVASEEKAKELRQKIANGEEFEALAKENSTDAQTAPKGGELGWITQKDVPKSFAAVLTLNEGDVSEPVKSDYGWHLIKVGGIQPARPLTFEECQADIQKIVLQTKQREARKLWVGKLREVAEIRINDKAVREYVKQNPFAADDPKDGGVPAMPSGHGMPASGPTAGMPPGHGM